MSVNKIFPKPLPNLASLYEAAPNEHYLYESSLRLRAKFAFLFIAAPFSAVGQFAYRVCDLAQTNFYKRGILQSNSVCCPVLKEFIYSIARCVFFIFYCIGVESISLFGILCPLSARRMLCQLEQLFYVPPLDPYQSSIVEWFGNFLVPTMQSEEFRSDHHLMRFNLDYSPHSISTLLHRMQANFARIESELDPQIAYEMEMQLDRIHEMLTQTPEQRAREYWFIQRTRNFDPYMIYESEPDEYLSNLSSFRPRLLAICEYMEEGNIEAAKEMITNLESDFKSSRLNWESFTVEHFSDQILGQLQISKKHFRRESRRWIFLTLHQLRQRLKITPESNIKEIQFMKRTPEFNPAHYYETERDPTQRHLSWIRSRLLIVKEDLEFLAQNHPDPRENANRKENIFSLLKDLDDRYKLGAPPMPPIFKAYLD